MSPDSMLTECGHHSLMLNDARLGFLLLLLAHVAYHALRHKAYMLGKLFAWAAHYLRKTRRPCHLSCAWLNLHAVVQGGGRDRA